nr:hypothetical protein [Candidatus Microthrix sp.]
MSSRPATPSPTARRAAGPGRPARRHGGGRAAGHAGREAKDLAGSARRLAGQAAPRARRGHRRPGAGGRSVSLTVIGPRVLGRATGVIVAGQRRPGIDFAQAAHPGSLRRALPGGLGLA